MFVPIKRSSALMAPAEPSAVSYIIPVMVLKTPQGEKSIPNPHGQEARSFSSLSAAVEAIELAGFDAEFEGRHVKLADLQEESGGFSQRKAAKPLQSVTQVQAEQLVKEGLLQAIPLLIDRLQDKEFYTVVHATKTLGVLTPAEALSPLMALLGHDSPDVREAVVEALAHYGASIVLTLGSSYSKLKAEGKGEQAYRKRLDIINTYLAISKRYPTNTLAGIMSQLLEGLRDEQWLIRSASAQVLNQLAARRLEEQAALMAKQQPTAKAGGF
jgi:hypothetical protein